MGACLLFSDAAEADPLEAVALVHVLFPGDGPSVGKSVATFDGAVTDDLCHVAHHVIDTVWAAVMKFEMEHNRNGNRLFVHGFFEAPFEVGVLACRFAVAPCVDASGGSVAHTTQ